MKGVALTESAGGCFQFRLFKSFVCKKARAFLQSTWFFIVALGDLLMIDLQQLVSLSLAGFLTRFDFGIGLPRGVSLWVDFQSLGHLFIHPSNTLFFL